MPRLSDATRSQRRSRILVGAWGCFSRNGFQATSMDDVIAASGMSAAAVYRYFRSKDELIDAAAEEALAVVRDLFAELSASDPMPRPAQVIAALVDEVQSRSSRTDYDLSKLAVQGWAEALRRPALREHTRAIYVEAHARVVELATRWRAEHILPPDADPAAVASLFVLLMPGLIVTHQLLGDTTADDLTAAIAALGHSGD